MAPFIRPVEGLEGVGRRERGGVGLVVDFIGSVIKQAAMSGGGGGGVSVMLLIASAGDIQQMGE